MNLQEIRLLFLQASGRYDLVGSDGAGTGADIFIDAGQKLLDSMQDTANSIVRYVATVPANTYRLTFQGCRSIKEVWIAESEGRSRLIRLGPQQFRAAYPTLFANIDSSADPPVLVHPVSDGVYAPTHWCIDAIHVTPDMELTTSSTLTADYLDEMAHDAGDLELADAYALRGILIGPASDKEYTINVYGKFFSRKLNAAADRSYWSEQYPLILVLAAMFYLETFYRNFSGAQEYMGAIKESMVGIERDVVDDVYEESEAMDG